jgi:O-antigen/teichoic acid export membrane protein
MLSDLKKIFSQSIIYGLGTMAPKLAGLVLIPLYTKHFPLSDFGIIGLLDSTSQIIIGILGFALYQGFFRWYFDKAIELKRKSLFFTLLIVHVFIALIGISILWPISGMISKLLFGHIGYTYLVRIMAIASLVQMMIIMPSTLMRVQERAGLYTIGNLLQMAVMMVCTIYLVVVEKQGVEAIYHAQIVGLVAYILLLSHYMFKNSNLKVEWKILWDIVKFCFPLVLSSIAVVLLNQADRYVIKAFGQLGDVGLYTLGFRLSNTLNIILVASISFAIQPLIFKKMDDPDNKRFYSKLMTYFVFIVMFFVLGMTLFGKEIVKIFARREEYYDAYKVIPVLSFAILLNMMKDMAMIGLQITKKTKIIAAIVVIVSVTGILINLFLVPLLHNQGAAIARLLSSLLFFFLIYYYSQKAYPIQYEFRKLVLLVTVGALLYLPAMMVNDNSLLIRLTVKTFLIATYPFILLLLGFFEKVEIQGIKGAWAKWKHPRALIENLKSIVK